MAFATEEWSGSNLTIYGSTNPVATCVKRMDGETLSAGWIKIGTEAGNASLVAVNSTLTLTDALYVGYEKSPGHPTSLSATLFLTNSTLTCGGKNGLTLGYDIVGSGPVSAEIGPGSVVTCRRVYRYGNPSPTLTFTGGRMVFEGNSDAYVFVMEGHTWKGTWPNNGATVRGDGAPIDVDVPNVRKLAGGWSTRRVNLSGDGGFVKRGAGKLIWGWHTYGSNSGYMNCTVDYTGDTVIKAGGIELATPSDVAKNQITYKTAAGSALKIEEGAYFDFAGNPATFLGVSGAGMLTNSAATVATLTLGSSNGDGEFSPAIVGGPIDVVKAGTGTLTFGVSRLEGTLVVSNGTVKVASGSSLVCENIIVWPSAILDVRGAHITCDKLSAARTPILWDADTVFDCTIEVEKSGSFPAGGFGFGGALRKTGSGTLTLVGQSSKSNGSVSIEAGAVVCKPASTWAGKYFIVNFFGDVSKNTDNGVSASEFSLFGTDGNRVNHGKYSYTSVPRAETQKYGNYGGIDDATQLAECEVAVWMPNHDGYIGTTGHAPANLFDGNASTTHRFTYYWIDSNKLVFRITNSAPEVIGFSFTTDDHPERRPTQWKLWGSMDGVEWTMLADNSTNTNDAATWTYLTNSTPDTALTEYDLCLLDKLPATSSAYAPLGEAEVSVADGATLDFASDEMLISHLKVDMDAGGGTITSCTPAANGTIDLDSASAVASGRVIPLTVSNMASPDNLRSWTVKVNGVERTDLGVRWSNGVLRVAGGGVQIIFR